MPLTRGHIALLLATLSLAACSPPDTPPPAEDGNTDLPADVAIADPPAHTAVPTTAAVDTELLGAQHWRLQNATDAQGQRIAALLVRPQQPIQFDLHDGRIRVENACNGLSGEYQLLGDEIRIGRLAGTKMGCAEQAISNLDNEIGKRLQDSARIALRPGTPPRLEWRTPEGDTLYFIGETTAAARYGNEGETIFLEVAAARTPCPPGFASASGDCLQVRELRYDDTGVLQHDLPPWQTWPMVIDGFTHEPGIRNVLRVKRYPIVGAAPDRPQAAYVLEMVVESEGVTP